GDGFEIVADEFIGPSKIGDAEPEAVRLGHVEATLWIKAETAGIFNKGESDPGVPFETVVPDQPAEGYGGIAQGRHFVLGHCRERFKTGLQFSRSDGLKATRRKGEHET